MRWVHVPHSTFPLFSQQTKERVKLLIQLADGFCEKGHAHAAEIKKCVTAVDKRYRDFSLRMEKYRTSLEKALGISSDSNKSVIALCAFGPVVISVPCQSQLPSLTGFTDSRSTEQKPSAGHHSCQHPWVRGQASGRCSRTQ